MRWLFFFGAGLIFSGCATPARQTDALLGQKINLPLAQQINGVPFVEQSAGYCGPATLTMALQWAGASVSMQEIAKEVYTPGMRGSLQLDLVSAARRNGMMALPLEGLNDLLQEVAAGHPVIIFENLGLTWFPQWHYAIVFGYDLTREEVLMHSGPEANKRWDLRHFERSWMLGDYWGLVVLPPGQLGASAGELTHATAAAALEQIGKIQEARKAYLSLLQRWPSSLVALVGLGNISFVEKDYVASVRYLRLATKAHPESIAAKNNLLVAESELRRH